MSTCFQWNINGTSRASLLAAVVAETIPLHTMEFHPWQVEGNLLRWRLFSLCHGGGVSSLDSLASENIKTVMKFLHGTFQDMFNHLFDVINMPTQISHTCLRAGNNFLVKEEKGIPFFHYEDTVDVNTSFQQCETRQRYHTRKQVRGEKNNSMSKGRPKSIGMWDNRILFNNLNLTTLASINQNLPECLYCITK